MKKFWLLIIGVIISFNIFANVNSSISSIEAFQVQIVAQDKHFAWVKFNISPGYYLYQDKIDIQTASDSNVKFGKLVLPDPVVITNELNESVNVYKNSLAIQVPIDNYANGIVHILLSYQGCKGTSLCLPEVNLDQVIDLNSGTVVDSKNVEITKAVPNKNLSGITEYFIGSPTMIIISFFCLGLLIAFTPCVFPLFPILFTIVSNQSINLMRGFILALSYILGGAVVYAIAGIIAVSLGASLSSYLQIDFVNYVIAGLFFLFALSMYDLFEIKLPAKLQTKLGNIANSMHGVSVFTTFIIGGISNLILSPCVTAPLASALVYISSTHNYILGGSALFALGFGSGVPLLAISLFGKKFLPKSGNWMVFTKRLLAVVMIAMAGYTLSKVLFDYDDIILAAVLIIILATFSRSAYLIISRKWLVNLITIIGVFLTVFLYKQYTATKMLSADDGFNKITQVSQLQEYMKIAELNRKPIILDFYANWCSACREMDLRTFSNRDVQKELSAYELIRVDSTYNTNDIRQMQSQYNIYALPSVIILYPNGVVADGFQTYGFLNSADFTFKLQKFNSDLTQICTLDKNDKRC